MPKPRIHYIIEKLDVDGDGIPDGDLVKKYVGNKLVSQKFVPVARIKKIVRNAQLKSNSNASPAQERIVYQRSPSKPPADKPVVIQSDTHFGHYVKAGAGLTVGSMAIEGLVSGIAGLFSE